MGCRLEAKRLASIIVSEKKGGNIKHFSKAATINAAEERNSAMEHPVHEGRYTVVWFFGELSVDYESEFSISNPLKATIAFALKAFPHIKLPNGTYGIYEILEIPEGEQP